MFRFIFYLLAAVLLQAGPPPQAGRGKPVRVVSQTVGTDELLLALAEPAQVAALSHLAREAQFSAVATEAAAFPYITGQDAEGILRFKPDLVLVSSYSRAELVSQLRRSGVRVLSFDRFNTLEEVYGNLRLLGRELGAETRAEALVAKCKARMADLERRLAGVPRKRVLAPSTYTFTGGKDTTFDDLCIHGGALNVAAEAGLVGHVPTPSEALLTWKVDYLVLAGDDGPAALARFRQITPYKLMEVTRAGRYVLIKGHQLSSVTHHRIDAYESLARQLHPGRFR